MRTPCRPLIFIVRWAIIGSNEWQLSFLLFYPPPPCSSLRTRLPRNNNRGCVHQHSFMAPHYAKRRAKGAWHFLSVGRRIRKDRLRLPLLAFFLLFNSGVSRSAPSLSCSRRDSRRRSNPVAIRKTCCISNCQEASNRQELNIDVKHVSFIVKFLSRLTFRYIERIDMSRTLVSDFINCIDTWAMSGSAAVDVRRCAQRWRSFYMRILLTYLIIYI